MKNGVLLAVHRSSSGRERIGPVAFGSILRFVARLTRWKRPSAHRAVNGTMEATRLPGSPASPAHSVH